MYESYIRMPKSSVFRFRDYREFIQSVTVPRAGKGGRTQASLAKAMGCQAAYLSQALKGKADLTEDHALGLCRLLGFDAMETEYFLCLLRGSRAATPALREYLENRRRELSDRRRELESRIAAKPRDEGIEGSAYYCSSWIPAILHLATSCPDYRTPEKLGARFGLPGAEVERHLRALQEYGWVRREGEAWVFAGGSFHFPKSAPIDPLFQTSRRLHALAHLPRRREDDVHYASVFAIDAATAEAIRARIVDLLGKAHRLAGAAPSDEVYSLNLDFFRA